MMFFSRERWRTIWLRRVTSRRLRRLVGDPDLRQKAAGVELRQHTSIDLIGFDLGMGNEADLFGVGDNHPADVRSDHCGNRSRIAGGFDDDNIAVGQLLGKFLQSLAAHDDATQPAELAVFPGHRLGKSAVNIQSNDPHTSTLRSRRLNGSSRATRHLLIRARSASGQVARGGHVTSSGSQPRVCRRPARTFVLPTPRVPDGLTITRFPEEAADTGAPKIIMPDNGICERFHRTVLDEFYRIAFRKKIDHTIDELQTDLDTWLVDYNYRRPNQGRWCFGKTPMQTLLDALPLAKEKLMAA